MEIETFVNNIKKLTKLPVILFPGNISGVASNADAILFMSLLNSDNPYFITGAQALGSISVKKHNIEPLPTAYLCLLYTSPSPRDGLLSRMPSSA